MNGMHVLCIKQALFNFFVSWRAPTLYLTIMTHQSFLQQLAKFRSSVGFGVILTQSKDKRGLTANMKLNYRVLLRQKSDPRKLSTAQTDRNVRSCRHSLSFGGLGLLTIKIGCYGREG